MVAAAKGTASRARDKEAEDREKEERKRIKDEKAAKRAADKEEKDRRKREKEEKEQHDKEAEARQASLAEINIWSKYRVPARHGAASSVPVDPASQAGSPPAAGSGGETGEVVAGGPAAPGPAAGSGGETDEVVAGGPAAPEPWFVSTGDGHAEGGQEESELAEGGQAKGGAPGGRKANGGPAGREACLTGPEIPRFPSCSYCKNPVDPIRCQIRSKSAGTWQCPVCHTRTVQLSKRFVSWPPRSFRLMSDKEKTNFWQAAATTPNVVELEVLVVNTMVTSRVEREEAKVGGEYLPLSVYAKRSCWVQHIPARVYPEPARFVRIQRLIR